MYYVQLQENGGGYIVRDRETETESMYVADKKEAKSKQRGWRKGDSDVEEILENVMHESKGK